MSTCEVSTDVHLNICAHFIIEWALNYFQIKNGLLYNVVGPTSEGPSLLTDILIPTIILGSISLSWDD